MNKLERQIVLADTQVFSAVSLFLQQELTGYVRGCWMLRKAWRVYQHAYTQISQLYRRTFGTNPTGTLRPLIRFIKLKRSANYNFNHNNFVTFVNKQYLIIIAIVLLNEIFIKNFIK